MSNTRRLPTRQAARRRTAGLVPLREIGADGQRIAEIQAERRITRAWIHIVGPALVRHTRLLRVRHHTLIVGCWRTDLMTNLRKSAEAVWPQMKTRLERLLGLTFLRMDIVPCDPPDPPAEALQVEDPLAQVLRKYRSQRNQGWTSTEK